MKKIFILFCNCLVVRFFFFLSIILYLSGCSVYNRGGLVREDKIDETEKITNWTYDYKIIENPSYDSPFIKIKFNKIPTRTYQSQTKYAEIRSRDNSSLILGDFWMGFSFLLGSYFLLFEKINDSEKKTMIVLVSVPILWGVATNIPTEPTGDLIDGEIKKYEMKGESRNAANAIIKFELNGIKKTLTTDSNGMVTFSPTYDSNVKSSIDPNPLSLHLYISESNQNFYVSLNPKLWMRKHVRIINRDINIDSYVDDKIVVVGKALLNETYELIGEATNYKIRFNGKEGFIPKTSAEIIWLSKN